MPRSMIDVPHAGGVDLSRLERGVGLEVMGVGPGRYAVCGGSEPHWVDLRTPDHPRCDYCGDHLRREQVQAHPGRAAARGISACARAQRRRDQPSRMHAGFL